MSPELPSRLTHIEETPHRHHSICSFLPRFRSPCPTVLPQSSNFEPTKPEYNTMRLSAALVLMAGSAAAFAPAQQAGGARQMALASTLEYEAIIGSGSSVSVGDFNSKLAANREAMSAKDKTSKSLGKSVSIFASKLNLQWHIMMCCFTPRYRRVAQTSHTAGS